jgi:hypothetical protein
MAYRIDEGEGPVSFTPIRGLNAPTRQDTIDLIQRSEAVRQFMENALDDKGKRMYEPDETISRKRSMPKAAAMSKLENARNAMAQREAMQGRTTMASDQGRTAGILPFADYAKQISPERFEQREIESQIINPAAPMSMYDTRIQPDTVYLYKQRTKNGLAPDLVSVPGYSTRMAPKEFPNVEREPLSIVQPVGRPPQRIPRQENVERVSFGTRGNRPLYSPGPAGRRGGSNRMQGQGALMNAWEKIRDILD